MIVCANRVAISIFDPYKLIFLEINLVITYFISIFGIPSCSDGGIKFHKNCA